MSSDNMNCNHSMYAGSSSDNNLYVPTEYDRPGYSYKELILKVFALVRFKPLELRDIYFLISATFPYYKPGGAWQTVIRLVLCTDNTFFAEPCSNLWHVVTERVGHSSDIQRHTDRLSVYKPLPNGANIPCNEQAISNYERSSCCTKIQRPPIFNGTVPSFTNTPSMTLCESMSKYFGNSTCDYPCYNGASETRSMCCQHKQCFEGSYYSQGSIPVCSSSTCCSTPNVFQPLPFNSTQKVPDCIQSDFQSPIFSNSRTNCSLQPGGSCVTDSISDSFKNINSKISENIYFTPEINKCNLSSNSSTTNRIIDCDVRLNFSELENCSDCESFTPEVDITSCRFDNVFSKDEQLNDETNASLITPPNSTEIPQSKINVPRTEGDAITEPSYSKVKELFDSQISSSVSSCKYIKQANIVVEKSPKSLPSTNLFHEDCYSLDSNYLSKDSESEVDFSSSKSHDDLPLESDTFSAIPSSLKLSSVHEDAKNNYHTTDFSNLETSFDSSREDPAKLCNILKDTEKNKHKTSHPGLRISHNLTTKNTPKQCNDDDAEENSFTTTRPNIKTLNSSKEDRFDLSNISNSSKEPIHFQELKSYQNSSSELIIDKQISSLDQGQLKLTRRSSETSSSPINELDNTDGKTRIQNMDVDSSSFSSITYPVPHQEELNLLKESPGKEFIENSQTSILPEEKQLNSTNCSEIENSQTSLLPEEKQLNSTNCSEIENSQTSILPEEKQLNSTNCSEIENNITDKSDCQKYMKECSVRLNRLTDLTVDQTYTLLHNNDITNTDGSTLRSTSWTESEVGETSSKGKKCSSKRKVLPKHVAGFSKPSYSFPMMITQALALCKKMQATAMEICNLIAEKYPYFKFHPKPNDWRGSVFSCLTNRRKFFVIVGSNENEEYIWSLNPSFEKYMLHKWVPKYLKKKEKEASERSENICKPVNINSRFTTENMAHLSPVIISCESLKSQSDPNQGVFEEENPEDINNPDQLNDSCRKDTLWGPDGPENVLADPSELSCPNETEPLWEPELDVPENVLADPSEHSRPKETEPLWEPESEPSSVNARGHSQSYRIPLPMPGAVKCPAKDFTLDNLHFKHVITNDEINYRLHFHKEHPLIQKFRLHCTVCDVHLGTSPSNVKSSVRFHSNLGVLTCKACYEKTMVVRPSGDAHCLWCMNTTKHTHIVQNSNNTKHYTCQRCMSKFCQECISRNFGCSWIIGSRKSWECFLCDTKQIWPHRAIAYFLFRHYGDLKRKINQMMKAPAYLPLGDTSFWVKDMSTCCTPSNTASPLQDVITQPPKTGCNLKTSNLPILPQNFLPPNAVTNPSIGFNRGLSHAGNPKPPSTIKTQTVTIDNKFPNQISVQSTAGVPSVTLNTGTQYIRNVYPDKNYVVVQPSVSSNMVTASCSPTSSQLPLSTSVINTTAEPTVQVIPNTDSFGNAHIPFRADVVNEDSRSVVKILPPINKTILQNDSAAIEFNSTLESSSFCRIINTPDETLIVPDKVFTPSTSEKDGNVTLVNDDRIITAPLSTPEVPKNTRAPLSLKERIERRPMPKSKKESLLRTLLVDDGVKAPLDVRETYNSSSSNFTSNEPVVVSEPMEIDNVHGSHTVQSIDACQNDEGPILKSIIQTAMERLMRNNLQKTQNLSSGINNTNLPNDTTMEVDQNDSQMFDYSLSELKNNVNQSVAYENKNETGLIPKIKIKTLQELQEPPKIVLAGNDENEHSDKQPVKNDLIDESAENETDIDIKDLKQGIIEASRTLINTQKKFKELAKVISKELTYKPTQARELVSKFQHILKSCRKQLDDINKNVQNQYDNLKPRYDLDSILQSVKASEKSKVKYQKKRSKNSTGSDIILSHWTSENNAENEGFTGIKFKKTKRNWNETEEERESQYPDLKRTYKSASDHESQSHNSEKEEDNDAYERNLDLVHVNSLGKNKIVENPEITNELQEFPSSSWESTNSTTLNSASVKKERLSKKSIKRNALLSCYRKREIWSNKRRKKSGVQVNQNGPIRKQRGRPPKSPVANRNAQNSSRPLSVPLRSSSRNHPSTASIYGQSSPQPDIVAYLPKNCIIKPCSVVVDRLDSRIVELLYKRVK